MATVGGVGALVCPTCGATLRDGAAWRRLRDIPGALPAFALDHRRVGGGRCLTVRGAWIGEGCAGNPANACPTAGDGCMIDASSRSARVDELATAP